MVVQTPTVMRICRYCGRSIVVDAARGVWFEPANRGTRCHPSLASSVRHAPATAEGGK
jgi:hypothetical protein